MDIRFHIQTLVISLIIVALIAVPAYLIGQSMKEKDQQRIVNEKHERSKKIQERVLKGVPEDREGKLKWLEDNAR